MFRSVLNLSCLDRWEIQLKTMFDGKPHPSAQTPVLPYVSVRELGFDSWEISITGSRLALICMFYDGSGVTAQLVVWDWNTGEILLVHFTSLSRSPLMQIGH